MRSACLIGSDVEEEAAAAMALGQDSDEFSVEDDSEEDSEASSDAGEQLQHCGCTAAVNLTVTSLLDCKIQAAGGRQPARLHLLNCLFHNHMVQGC